MRAKPERRCPVMFVPATADRSLSREAWKWFDHMTRLIWREQGDQIQKAVAEEMIYGSSEIRL